MYVSLYLFVILRSRWSCDDVLFSVTKLTFAMMFIVYCVLMKSIARCRWVFHEIHKMLVKICPRSKRGENPRTMWQKMIVKRLVS